MPKSFSHVYNPPYAVYAVEALRSNKFSPSLQSKQMQIRFHHISRIDSGSSTKFLSQFELFKLVFMIFKITGGILTAQSLEAVGNFLDL
jgi:hypothetical protein